MDATVPSLIAAVERGDADAREALFAALYADLHRLARRELARPSANVSLGVTTLLHEAYLDMSARGGASFPDRARFMGYAARVMRGLIIDHARSRRAAKRGGAFELTSIETDVADPSIDHRELERISDALDELARSDQGLADIVDLRFFCGFSFGEIAGMRGISERTAQRNWEKARIFLYRMLDSRTSI